ncbi:MAG: glycosyltransferase family 9 protein [Verrucomicrobiota bacterium]
MDLESCERVLIVKPSSLGDVIHTVPALGALRAQLPEATIDWLINPEWAPLIAGSEALDDTIIFPRKDFRGITGLNRARRWAQETFAERHYDLALDFQGLFRSGWLTRASRAPQRVGFRQSREGARLAYTMKVDLPDWKSRHAVSRNLALVESLGVPLGADAAAHYPLAGGEPMPDLPDVPFVALHPFSRGIGKSLGKADVIELVEALAPHPVVLLGNRSPYELLDGPANLVSLIGRTSLTQLISVLSDASYIISVDSGPMHLAAAVTDRVLSIHTWSNPAMVGPHRSGAFVFREGEILSFDELDANDFPEERQRRPEWASAERILDGPDIDLIASHIHSQISP